MRGKKVDKEFLSQFLSKCLANNIFEQSEIDEIDNQIKHVEKLKLIRTKLLDVVSTFEKKTCSHTEEIRILSFFQIQKPEVCKFICHKLKDSSLEINSLDNELYHMDDIMFCIKQLIEHKIISKTGNFLIKGSAFSDYVKFVFREV